MFCKLIVCANHWVKESDWKDLALVKLCMGALGVILGLTALRKNRRVSLAVSAAVFVLTWLPLMKKFARIVLRTLRGEEREIAQPSCACGCAQEDPTSFPEEEDWGCDVDRA